MEPEVVSGNSSPYQWTSQFEYDVSNKSSRRQAGEPTNICGGTYAGGNPDGVPDQLLEETDYPYQKPTAIYVKGGPVRVKGTY